VRVCAGAADTRRRLALRGINYASDIIASKPAAGGRTAHHAGRTTHGLCYY